MIFLQFLVKCSLISLLKLTSDARNFSYGHTKIKVLKSIFIIFLRKNESKTGVLHSFSIKKIFYDKMDLILSYFHVTIWVVSASQWCVEGLVKEHLSL